MPPSSVPWSVITKCCAINTLPSEILLEIFRFAMAFADVLSEISYSWRCIALSTPTLWTNIKVEATLGPNFTFKYHHTCNHVKRYLKNSRQLPLAVEVILRTSWGSLNMEDTEHPFHHCASEFKNITRALSRILAGQICRFQTFRLIVDDFVSVVDIQAHFPQVSMPLLESWTVHQNFVEQAFDVELQEPGDAAKLFIPLRPQSAMAQHFHDMYPNLKVTAFHAIPMMWAYFCPRHLQTLNISFLPIHARPTMVELRQILMATEHSLEVLIIQGAAPSDYSEPFELRRVRSLTLGFVEAVELVPLLKTMRVPNLSTLSITDFRRHCTSAADRAFVSCDRTMIHLFTGIVFHLPLEKIEVLLLRCIVFLPPHIDSPLRSLSRNKLNLPIPVLPMHFFHGMTSLKDLTLIDPDPITLHCLNFLPRKFNVDSSLSNRFSVSPLRTLRLNNFNLPSVQLFFQQRIQSHTSFRPVDEIVFSMPANWIHKLRFDFTLIAGNIRTIHVPVDRDTERYLMRRLF